ncbi:predicted protein [Uncinocarpus reesii 1704]|uniref:Uncharacterized protein n=1 Tax=Uncinocarpus reesii (strain UAMH 1704) TaxID=336963 RepID=C4JVJ1_UNCRE|nr:uncharacterized protein UREG_06583 [Uncinocarpus reesii 1704]EEP81718.1 predicted protein [Uncinocarpus reesii 1704]
MSRPANPRALRERDIGFLRTDIWYFSAFLAEADATHSLNILDLSIIFPVMGNKISAVNGVRSPNFFEPGNAVNEVWIGKLEIISRLPFGDSDMAQAGWPKGDYPKIPWRPFIIPLRASFGKMARSITSPASEASGKCGWPALVDVISKVDWNRWFWVVERMTSIPFFILPILLHFGPNDLTQGIVAIPCLEAGEDTEVAFQPRFRRHGIYLRAIFSNLFTVMGFCLLVLEPGETKNSLGRFGPVGVEETLYFLLATLCAYCNLRLTWALFRIESVSNRC